ncbi:MAG: SMC family ATPase [Anaerolineae bacterium]|nr:SMC family ATPase [Anaerolineae bacterium]
MIPHKLSLVNFMCYRQVTVDFSTVHLACLSGENGAGKSALLDAMTWALWGKARARRDDELIRLGADEMEVDFSFQLRQECYRVVRRRRAGRGASLALFARVDEQWSPLTSRTMRQTQQTVERLLRLDYDTFVNSAFLRQGRADEFTLKTPAERKRVLGDILGLERWRTYQERARTRLQALRQQTQALGFRLQEIDDELARRPEYQVQLDAAQAEVAAREATLHDTQADWQAMESARTELDRARSQVAELVDRLARGQEELERLARERRQLEERQEQNRAWIERAAEIEAGFAAYQQAVQQEREMEQKLARYAGLDERRVELEAQLDAARQELETQQQLAAQQVAELAARQPAAELRQQWEQAQAQAAHRAQLRHSHQAAQSDLSQLSEERAVLQAHNQQLRAEMEAVRDRLERLESAGADCPLCGQPLAGENRRQLIDNLQADGKRMGDTFRANRARLEEIAAKVSALRAQIDQGKALLEELPRLQQQAATLAERIRAGDEAAADLAAARAELARLQAELAAEKFAPAAQAALKDVLAEAAELGYDAAAYQAARQAVADGQRFVAQQAQLEAARTDLARAADARANLDEQARRWQEQVTTDRARQDEIEAQAAALEARLQHAPTTEEELAQARLAAAEAQQRLGAAQQRLAACQTLERQRQERRQRQKELAHLTTLYQDLQAAFDLQGVPAMLIAAAVPEIEREANRLLERMSGGRMQVRLETRRETQAGETRETLDVRIMDELGERPYENYSGGEQFRMNFALRIALSRLLAHRAGTELATLVIDEGFGTQDAAGRQRLLEAIYAIQDEFARVLVITHIEELRDAFPNCIEVTKTPHGSTVTMT